MSAAESEFRSTDLTREANPKKENDVIISAIRYHCYNNNNNKTQVSSHHRIVNQSTTTSIRQPSFTIIYKFVNKLIGDIMCI